jgi:hypothetical protein
MDAETKALQEFFADISSSSDLTSAFNVNEFSQLNPSDFNIGRIETLYSLAYNQANSTNQSIKDALSQDLYFVSTLTKFSTQTSTLIGHLSLVSTPTTNTLIPEYTTNYTAIQLRADAELAKAQWLGEVITAIQARPVVQTPDTELATTLSEQRYKESAHPDQQNVSFYTSIFPLTRALTAPWLYALMFVSTVITILSIGVFLRFANVEFEIKLPSSGSSGSDGLLGMFSSISPTMYTALVGGGIVVGAGIAYAISRYS